MTSLRVHTLARHLSKIGRHATAGANTVEQHPAAHTAQPLEVGKLHCWYADHEEVLLPDGHRFPMDKYRATRLLLQSEAQTSAITSFYPSPAAPKADLTRVHTREYVERFEAGTLSEKEMRAIGFPWTQSIVRRNFASAGGTLAAAKALLSQPELKMTAHVSGGTHHSFADRGEGFCVFNDIAVATAYGLEAHGLERVLVVDLDVHQGNGTADIFAHDPRVTTFDMFCDQNYPWATRRTNTYDVALQPDVSGGEYLATLRRYLDTLGSRHDPQMVVYQAGVDALAEDALGKMNLSRETLGARNNAVYSFALELGAPLLITMGGGYAKPDVLPSVVAHADVYRTAALRVAAPVPPIPAP